jgi:ABC-type polysaccharide/polyol phosphate export systems, permease component
MGPGSTSHEVEDIAFSSLEVMYTPDSIRRRGWHVWRTIINEFLNSRELIWRLILRDIAARYRQSMFGYLWAVLPSIVTVIVFAALTQSQTIPVAETALPYVAYALWSISVWQLFAGCLSVCTNSLVSAGSLVSKVNFPKEALVIAAIGHPLLDFMIRLVLVAFVFIWYGVPFKAQMIFVPFILLPAILLAIGLSFVLSIINLVLRDIGSILGVTLTFGMFLTPVLYPPPTTWPSSLINILNPLSPVLIASQDVIAYGSLLQPQAFLFSSLFSMLVFLVGWRLFRLTIYRVSTYA